MMVPLFIYLILETAAATAATTSAAFSWLTIGFVSLLHTCIKRASFGFAESFKSIRSTMSYTAKLSVPIAHFTSGYRFYNTLLRGSKSFATPAHSLHHLMTFV